jgi:hypothetical protein
LTKQAYSPNQIPVSWLRPLPEGYKIPIWRWVLLPATAIMLKRQGGVWMSGTLEIGDEELRFAQSQMVKSARNPAINWGIKLADISSINVASGMVSDTLQVEYSGGSVKFMTVRAGDFVSRLRAAVPAA